MILYAFDVDETLEVSHGPVPVVDVINLRNAGHTVGLCGNWNIATHRIEGWQHLFAFIGPIGTDKPTYLRQLRDHLPPHDDYVLVGNDHANATRAYSSPNDAAIAEEADWRFISETDFAGGAR